METVMLPVIQTDNVTQGDNVTGKGRTPVHYKQCLAALQAEPAH